MTKAGLILPALALSGCAQLSEWQEKFEGYTNPLVAQAMFIGVAEPESAFIDLSGTDFGSGAAVQVFLADASNVNDLENAPVSGGAVQVRVGGGPALPLYEEDAGAYRATGVEGLDYVAGEDTDLSIAINGQQGGATGTLPEAADLDVDWYQDGTDLAIDLSDHSFDTVLGVVIDMVSGELVWTNEPTDISELYEMTHASEPVKRLVIPGAVLSRESVYAVGVAGMMVTAEEALEGINLALSSYMQGQLVFSPVCTYGEQLCAEITPEDLESLP